MHLRASEVVSNEGRGLTNSAPAETIWELHPSACGPVAQLGARFHGMEEVAGSIPARSTNSPNNLDGANADSDGVCVMVCVITRRSSAHRKGFHRCPLRFHPHVTVPLQHSTADVSGNRHDG